MQVMGSWSVWRLLNIFQLNIKRESVQRKKVFGAIKKKKEAPYLDLLLLIYFFILKEISFLFSWDIIYYRVPNTITCISYNLVFQHIQKF